MSESIKDILARVRTIAVYGMSRDETKAAYRIPKQMADWGFDVTPVNLFADEIMGRKSYKTLAEVPGSIDLVDVFRPSEAVLPVVREAIERHQVRGDCGVVWLQLGIANEEARRLAEEAGLTFVQDRCLKVEFARYFPDKAGH